MLRFYNIVFKTKHKIYSPRVSPHPQLKILGACQSWNKHSCCILSIPSLSVSYQYITLSCSILSIHYFAVSFQYCLLVHRIITLSCCILSALSLVLSCQYITLLYSIITLSCSILSVH